MAKKEQSIVMAIESLVADGVKNPTNQQVRERLGSGSFSDIAPVLKIYKEERDKTKSMVMLMPTALKEQVEASLQQLWRVASELSSERLIAMEEKHSLERQEWELERQELFDCIQGLDEQEGRWIARLDELKLERSALQDKLEEKNREIIELKLENQKLTIRLRQLLNNGHSPDDILQEIPDVPRIILPSSLK